MVAWNFVKFEKKNLICVSMLFLANFGNFDMVCSGQKLVWGSNQGVRGLHNDWSDVFQVGNDGRKKFFGGSPSV